MRQWIAERLCPQLARGAERYWYLWHQVDDLNKWCDGEARDAAQWLLDQDEDHWRSKNVPAGARATPWGIQNFREWIYRKRAVPHSAHVTATEGETR
jgi:hypothetical protein